MVAPFHRQHIYILGRCPELTLESRLNSDHVLQDSSRGDTPNGISPYLGFEHEISMVKVETVLPLHSITFLVGLKYMRIAQSAVVWQKTKISCYIESVMKWSQQAPVV